MTVVPVHKLFTEFDPLPIRVHSQSHENILALMQLIIRVPMYILSWHWSRGCFYETFPDEEECIQTHKRCHCTYYLQNLLLD